MVIQLSYKYAHIMFYMCVVSFIPMHCPDCLHVLSGKYSNLFHQTTATTPIVKTSVVGSALTF